jgi:hypothetical protein
MTLTENITALNSIFNDNISWLTTKGIASKVVINDGLGYAIEKEYKDRENVMPDDKRSPISYFVIRPGGSAQTIRGSESRVIQRGQRLNYKVRQIFIINVNDVTDDASSLFPDTMSLIRARITDIYINKQVNTGFSVEAYHEDLENVFEGVTVEPYESMRYPMVYVAIDSNVVVTADCL